MEQILLKDLLKGISSSVQEAQDYIDKSGIEQFFSYFQSNEESISKEYEPYIRNIMIPAEVSTMQKNTKVMVPLVAMVHHKRMLMDEVTITLHGKIMEGEKETSIMLNTKENDATDTDEIKLVYKCLDMTEGQDKVVSALVRNIE